MSKTATIEVSAISKRQTFISILIIGLLFFIFGFVSWLNSILIPYFKIACELTNFESYLVTFAFYISYFIMSVPSAFLLKKVGFKKGMMIGFWTMALGAFIFCTCGLSPYLRNIFAGTFYNRCWSCCSSNRSQSLYHYFRTERKRGTTHQHHGHLQ